MSEKKSKESPGSGNASRSRPGPVYTRMTPSTISNSKSPFAWGCHLKGSGAMREGRATSGRSPRSCGCVAGLNSHFSLRPAAAQSATVHDNPADHHNRMNGQSMVGSLHASIISTAAFNVANAWKFPDFLF